MPWPPGVGWGHNKENYFCRCLHRKIALHDSAERGGPRASCCQHSNIKKTIYAILPHKLCVVGFWDHLKRLGLGSCLEWTTPSSSFSSSYFMRVTHISSNSPAIAYIFLMECKIRYIKVVQFRVAEMKTYRTFSQFCITECVGKSASLVDLPGTLYLSSFYHQDNKTECHHITVKMLLRNCRVMNLYL
jgi:hypothetical protein